MSFQRFFSTMFLGSALALGALTGGCVSPAAPSDSDADVAADAEDTGDEAQALESDPDPDIFIISLNSLPPGLLMDPYYQAQMASLASGSLSTSTPLADTRDGVTLLAYIAVCALPEGSEVTISGTGSSAYRFKGHIGLTPGWQLGGLSGTEQRWLSACLLAHANAFGDAVEIDLRGNHPALVPSGDPEFNRQEAGFYGDLFQAGEAFACIGSSPSDSDGTASRVCGRTGRCEFTITGTCLPGSTDTVCGGGPVVYTNCKSGDSGQDFDEVITVYTRPGQFGNDESCTHPADEEGWPLDKTCSATTDAVCAADPYCCEVAWDAACVDLAAPPGNGF